MTGKGHLTDKVILETLPNCQVIFSSDDNIEHPNTMDIMIYKDNQLVGNERIYSVGGGKIIVKGDELQAVKKVYPHKFFYEIRNYHRDNHYDNILFFYEMLK